MSAALTVAVSAVALGAAGMILVGLYLSMEIRRSSRVAEMVFAGLNETHRLGFEALTISLERLEARVKALEER